jgi:hypothetical protein
MAVQLNDTIEIPAENWEAPINVEWRQTFQDRSGRYYRVQFKNVTGINPAHRPSSQ